MEAFDVTLGKLSEKKGQGMKIEYSDIGDTDPSTGQNVYD